MNQVKLKTTKYVRQSLKEEIAQSRTERRKAKGNLLLIAACFAIFMTSVFLIGKNPELFDKIQSYF